MPTPPQNEVRPILTRLTSIVEELGADVEVESSGSSVTFSRGRPFASLDAATPKRVDVGLVLRNTNATSRLRPADGAATHCVSLAHEDEIDGELITWLRDAYDAASK